MFLEWSEEVKVIRHWSGLYGAWVKHLQWNCFRVGLPHGLHCCHAEDLHLFSFKQP